MHGPPGFMTFQSAFFMAHGGPHCPTWKAHRLIICVHAKTSEWSVRHPCGPWHRVCTYLYDSSIYKEKDILCLRLSSKAFDQYATYYGVSNEVTDRCLFAFTCSPKLSITNLQELILRFENSCLIPC